MFKSIVNRERILPGAENTSRMAGSGLMDAATGQSVSPHTAYLLTIQSGMTAARPVGSAIMV